MTYTPDQDFNSTRGSESLSFTVNDQGNTGSGGPLSASASLPISITAVNDKPVAATKNFNVQANMKITYQINLAGNGTGDVTDPDIGDGGFTDQFTLTSVTAACTSVAPTGATSTCTISNINPATGTFDFDPPAGNPGAFALSYTVTDNGNPTPGQTSNPGTINITTLTPVIWFVDPARAANGNGTLSNTSSTVGPFNNLADAASKVAGGSALNQRVFVYSGTTASGTNIALQGSTSGTLAQAQAAAHWLIGQGAVSSSFDTLMGFSPPAGTIARPALNSNAATANAMRPTIRGTVTMKENTTVRGLNIDVSGVAGTPRGISALGLAGGSSGSALIIGDVNVTSAGGNAVDISTSSGTSSVTYTTSDSTNSPNILASVGGIALSVLNTTIGAAGFTFQKISANGGSKGISLNNTGAGAFTVSGVGTTAGSGGTIQNTTARGAEFISASSITLKNMNFTSATSVDGGSATVCGVDLINNDNTPCNAPIHLQSISTSATLNNISVNGSSQTGINGFDVRALSMTTVSVTNAGNAANEHGVVLKNLRGTNTITSSSFTSNHSRQLYVINTINDSPNPTPTLSITSTTFSGSVDLQGALFDSYGPTGNIIVNVGDDTVAGHNTFSNNFSNGLQQSIGPNGSVAGCCAAGSMTINIKRNTFTNNNSGIVLQAAGVASSAGTLNYTIWDNTTTTGANSGSGAIIASGTQQHQISGDIRGNIIGNASANSGAVCGGGCNGITVDSNDISAGGGGRHDVTIVGNTVRNVDSTAIRAVIGRKSKGNIVITGNLVEDPDNSPVAMASADLRTGRHRGGRSVVSGGHHRWHGQSRVRGLVPQRTP